MMLVYLMVVPYSLLLTAASRSFAISLISGILGFCYGAFLASLMDDIRFCEENNCIGASTATAKTRLSYESANLRLYIEANNIPVQLNVPRQ
jgi:hypothetical protein